MFTTIYRIICLFFLAFWSMTLSAATLTGKITDAKTKEALTGVIVQISGTEFSTLSDFDGNYTIANIPEGRYTINFQYVSYSSRSLIAIRLNDEEVRTLNIGLTKTGKWFEAISVKGYMQVRYNDLYNSNPDLTCEQCDKNWGGDPEFSLRRTRVVFYGNLAPRLYYYIQPDFASTVSGNLHVGQIKDAYFDLGLTSDNSIRIRAGQSKIPYGFENMQSSSNRMPFDRDDAINSALPNERDLGVMVYFAPAEKRQLLSDLVKTGLKGSGDYGVFAIGAFNGQTANKPELNKNKHIVARLSYPMAIGNQIIEPGIQAYTGIFVLSSDQISDSVGLPFDHSFIDQRMAMSFVLYPKPFGIMAEYNFGKGPEYNPTIDSITVQALHGFYTTFSYMARINRFLFTPYARIQYYNGGKKAELDSRSYEVKELEFGTEWLPFPQFELTLAYIISSRWTADHSNQNNLQKGSLLRVQGQVNF